MKDVKLMVGITKKEEEDAPSLMPIRFIQTVKRISYYRGLLVFSFRSGVWQREGEGDDNYKL